MKVSVQNVEPGVATLVTTVELDGPDEVRAAQIALWKAITNDGHSGIVLYHVQSLYDLIKEQTGIGAPGDVEPIGTQHRSDAALHARVASQTPRLRQPPAASGCRSISQPPGSYRRRSL